MTPKTILIVDDERVIREALQQVLELEGYTVLTAANGKEALDVLKHTALPSLILLDLMMPVMTGWDFLAAKEADAELAPIPVLVITAAGAAAQTIAPRVSGLVNKPFEVDLLLEQIRDCCL